MSSVSVILFHSSNYAMWAADVLKQAGIKHKMIPVPRELSSECGYCVKIDSSAGQEVSGLLTNENIEYERIVQI
jgi:hypothetical protein